MLNTLTRTDRSFKARWLLASLGALGVLAAALWTLPVVAQPSDPIITPGQFNPGPSQGSERGRGRGFDFGFGHRRVERAPCELSFRAYQAGSQLVILASGANPTGGFTTCFERSPFDGRMRVTLRNYAPDRGACVTQAITRFELAASLSVRGRVSTVGVVVAGRLYQVSVECPTDLGRAG